MQQNADMVTHAMIWHFMVPIAIIGVAMSLLGFAFWIVKILVRREFRKRYPQKPNRRR
jgi:hypothetical protein